MYFIVYVIFWCTKDIVLDSDWTVWSANFSGGTVKIQKRNATSSAITFFNLHWHLKIYLQQLPSVIECVKTNSMDSDLIFQRQFIPYLSRLTVNVEECMHEITFFFKWSIKATSNFIAFTAFQHRVHLLIQSKGGASDFPSILNTGHKNVTDNPFAITIDFVHYNFTTSSTRYKLQS